MTTFFISDLHLSEKHLDSYYLLVKFLENLPNSTEAIYILGDLFDFWIDDKLHTPFLTKIKLLLKQYTQKFSIYIIKGNRDFLLGKIFAEETGCTLLPDISVINLHHYKILLLHGDQLCANDSLYIYFTKIIRHPLIIWLFKLLPIRIKLRVAKILRILSENRQSLAKQSSLIKLRAKPLDEISTSIVEQLMLENVADILLHGHIHKPNIFHFNLYANFGVKIATRIVLSDWHTQASILAFDHTGYRLKTISI